MPDSGGKLTPEEKQKIIAWMNERGKSHTCPVCQENNWTVGDHLLSGMVYQGGNLLVGGTHYPQFFVTCNNCFYTRQFMAVTVLEMAKTATEEEGEEGGKKASGGDNG